GRTPTDSLAPIHPAGAGGSDCDGIGRGFGEHPGCGTPKGFAAFGRAHRALRDPAGRQRHRRRVVHRGEMQTVEQLGSMVLRSDRSCIELRRRMLTSLGSVSSSFDSAVRAAWLGDCARSLLDHNAPVLVHAYLENAAAGAVFAVRFERSTPIQMLSC